MNVKRKVEEWLAAELMSAEQAAAITTYENQRARRTIPWVVWGIAAIGGLAIVAGVISVVAANWDDLGPGVKLGAAMTLLLGTLFAAWRLTVRGWILARDVALLLHDGFVLANIGLVAQIYHLSGHPWRAAAVVTAFAALPVLISTRSLLVDVLVVSFSTTLAFVLTEFQEALHLDGLESMVPLMGVVGVLYLVGSGRLERIRPTAAHALRRWAIVLLGGLAVWAAVQWSDHSSLFVSTRRTQTWWPFVTYTAVSLLVLGGQLLFRRPGWIARALGLASLWLLFSGPLFFLGARDPSGGAFLARQGLGFAVFCVMCTAGAISSAHASSKLGMNVMTLALAIRVVVLYLELLRDLMTTGLGLISTGVVFFAVAYGWWRLRSLLAPRPGAEGAR